MFIVRLKRIISLLFIIIFLVVFTSFAENINLENSIKIAKKNNKKLKSCELSVKKSKWGEYNSITNFLPKFSLNETIIRIDDDTYKAMTSPLQIGGITLPVSAGDFAGIKYKTTYTTDMTVQQPIFNGGKLWLVYQLSKLIRQQSEITYLSEENDLEYRVVSLYFNILKLQSLREIAEKSVNSTNEHLKRVNEKYNVGTAKKSDVLEWQVKAENDKVAYDEVNNNLSIVLNMWKNTLGDEKLYLPEKINIDDYIDEVSTYWSISEDEKELKFKEVLNKVYKNNLDIKNLEIIEKISKKNHQLSISNFLPTINMQFTKQFERDNRLDFDGQDNWNIALAINFPFFESGKNYTNFRKTKYEMEETKFKLMDARENIIIGAKNSYFNLVTSAKKIKNNKYALSLAQENYKIINSLFEQGMVTNNDLMDAEIMLYASEMNYTTSVYDYIINKYELKKYTNE